MASNEVAPSVHRTFPRLTPSYSAACEPSNPSPDFVKYSTLARQLHAKFSSTKSDKMVSDDFNVFCPQEDGSMPIRGMAGMAEEEWSLDEAIEDFFHLGPHAGERFRLRNIDGRMGNGDIRHAERNRIADRFFFRCSPSTFSTLQPLLRPRSTSSRYEPNPMSSRKSSHSDMILTLRSSV